MKNSNAERKFANKILNLHEILRTNAMFPKKSTLVLDLIDRKIILVCCTSPSFHPFYTIIDPYYNTHLIFKEQ